MPVCVSLSVVKIMEQLDPPGQGEDGGLPHRPGLAPHTHRQLHLEGVHPVDLGVFLHNEPSVVVAQLPGPSPAGGGNTADGLEFLLRVEELHDAAGETLLPNEGFPDGLVGGPKLSLEQMSQGELVSGGGGDHSPPVVVLVLLQGGMLVIVI